MNFDVKVRIFSAIYFIVFVLVLLRLFYWQIIQSGRMQYLAETQHFAILDVPAKRGEIKTSDGFSIVSNKQAYLLYANLQKLKLDKNIVANQLSPILIKSNPIATTEAYLNDEIATVAAKLNNSIGTWVNIAHFLDRDSKKQIEDLNIEGLGFAAEETRDYPEASMAAHIVGLVGFDAMNNPQGYFGLEGFYNRELSGRAGEIKIERDAFGRPIPIGEEIRQESQDGRNLVTTIDRGVQKFVENNLETGIKKWKASGGTAIVMDPNNGAIIAMANFPKYDPQMFTFFPTTLYKNPSISDLYEPGSIFKPLVVASALNENAITPLTTCDKCDGPRLIEDTYVHTFDNKYRPNLTINEILINSDNTGMVFIGEKLGFGKLYQYVQNLGFGKKTGVDLQEEEEGQLKDVDSYYPIDKATLNFGQGIGVNALQMMKAWATLANGGYLITPHLVSNIESKERNIPLNWPKGQQIFTSNTTKVVSEMLARVTTESPIKFPLVYYPELSNFRISAKSGTAQIALGGKYKEKGTTASLIGYFPTDKPRFLVMVKLNEPEVRIWGSDTAGPIFLSILSDLVSYYSMTP